MNEQQRAAMEQARKALKNAYWPTEPSLMPAHNIKECGEAITALRRALEQPAYPEGDVVGPCICGSWPGGKCLKCPRIEQPAQQEPLVWSDEQLQMLNFLYGAGEFDGVWFDEKHPTEKTAFWWRKHLRRLFDTRPQAREPLSEVQIATVYWGATGQSLRPQDNALAHKFARAIEAAHGITGDSK